MKKLHMVEPSDLSAPCSRAVRGKDPARSGQADRLTTLSVIKLVNVVMVPGHHGAMRFSPTSGEQVRVSCAHH